MPNVDYCTCCIVQQSPFDFRLYEEWRDWPCRLVLESSPKSKACNGRVIMFQSHPPKRRRSQCIIHIFPFIAYVEGLESCLTRLLLLLAPRLWRLPRLILEPLVPEIQPSRAQSLQFSVDLVSVHGYLVRLLGLGPKFGDGKALVEVRAEIIHDADREHDVHAELENF